MLLRQRLGQLANPVAVHDTCDGVRAVAAAGENLSEPLQIGNRIEIERRLFRAVTAIKIRADGAMPRGAGHLANVVDVIDDRLDLDSGVLRCRFAADPTWNHHPG